jgi:DNA-3-methyladenine glycosylase II
VKEMLMTNIFELDAEEERVRRLCDADPRLASLIRTVGPLTITGRRDAFQSLARALIGQQLSVKAANTITERAVAACGGGMTPEAVLAVPEEELRATGVSRPKIGYLMALAQAAADGELDYAKLSGLPDEAVVAALTKIKGVGRWTAEMFLIFSLGREDVLSLGDVGLRRAARWLYGSGEPDPVADEAASVDLAQLGETWRPYRTIASLYLWEAVNRGLVGSH